MRPSGTRIRPGDYRLWKQKYWSHVGKKKIGAHMHVFTLKLTNVIMYKNR